MSWVLKKYSPNQLKTKDRVLFLSQEKNINMMAMSYKVHSDLKKTMNIPKPKVALKGFWDK